MMEKLFPNVIILLDLGASIVYICQGDYRRFVYWLAAAIITISVTY